MGTFLALEPLIVEAVEALIALIQHHESVGTAVSNTDKLAASVALLVEKIPGITTQEAALANEMGLYAVRAGVTVDRLNQLLGSQLQSFQATIQAAEQV